MMSSSPDEDGEVVSPLADIHPPSEKACSKDPPPKLAKSKQQFIKRPAKLPMIKDCRFSEVQVYEYFANNCHEMDNSCLHICSVQLPMKSSGSSSSYEPSMS